MSGPDIINWNRLEPHPRTDDQNAAVATGLEARVHDPLWLLGRQWQFREFEGEDTGSPVAVRLQLATTSLTRWSPSIDGSAPGQPLDVTAQPLETLVEREAVPFVGLRASGEAGLHFFALLDQGGRGALKSLYLGEFPLAPPAGVPLDPAAGRIARVLGGRAPDGVRLAAAFAASLRAQVPALPARPAIPDTDQKAVLAIAHTWLAWYESEIAPVGTTDTWVPERLEYRFSVGGSSPSGAGETVLAAPDYRGDGLDWYDFVHQPARSLGAAAAAPERRTWTGLPAPVTFRGMPAPRWWEFEDAAVDLGAVDTAPDDLARLLVTEFATIYGNDWYQIPIDLPVGSLTSVVSLVVTNSFGERRLIEPTALARREGGPWRMFHISEAGAGRGAGADLEALFLPPVVAAQMDSVPLEDVLFARDEMADMAWAIERVVQGASGLPADRTEEWQRSLATAAAAAAQAGAPPAPIAPLRYRLATTVPDHWIPLIPVHDGTPRGVRLERGAMLHFDGSVPTAIEPVGRLLTIPKPPLRFYEEEVPREGRRVQRVAILTRWYGGTIHGWITRRTRIGRGESSSGLRNDWAVPTDNPSP
jgi:hypothetical protein